MRFSLVDVAGEDFRTDEDSDRLNTEFMSYLGVTKRLLPARLAIARSLAIQSSPPPLPEKADLGKSIKGDTLFGTGAQLATWTTLIVERAGEADLELRSLRQHVARHWRRGILLLNDDWKAAEQDHSRFVRRLIEVAGVRAGGGSYGARPEVRDNGGFFGEILLPVGDMSEDAVSGEPVTWGLNAPGGSPHLAVMGGVGSGKTRTAVAMLRRLREQVSVPLLAFDFKGDLGEPADQSFSYRLDQVFQGTTVRPPQVPIPLDVLALPGRSEFEVTSAAQRFLESFSRLKQSGVGAKQQSALFEAVSRALRSTEHCSLTDILAALRAVYAQRGMDEDGAIAAMEEICRFTLFVPSQSPADFFSSSWVIALPASVPDRSRSIVVNLVLDALDRHLNSLPEAGEDENHNRALRIMCVIDEAHRILGTRVPGLSSLVRQSRSKGGSVMLISQSPDDFAGEEDDFLSEMGLIAAFATNARPAQVTRLIGKGTNLANLPVGQCVVKMRGGAGPQIVQAWQR
jgi:DNA sulfur modification protein DndE